MTGRAVHREAVEALPTRIVGTAALLAAGGLWIVLGWIIAHTASTTSQTILATCFAPCLLGITWIGLDMASDMALGRLMRRQRS